MNIQEAVKQALKTGKGIQRKSQEELPIWFLPTNTPVYIAIMDGEKMISKKWNPEADDLLADDWKIKE